MAISASDVKKLREKTGAGMMDCKKALTETNGDFAKAEKILKEKGLAAVENRAGRATNEGKVFIKKNDTAAALVEVDTETDFVARNPDFIAMGEAMADKVLQNNWDAPNAELEAMVKDLATKIRENMGLKKVMLVKAGAGEYLDTYLHGDGAIGTIVVCASDKPEILAKPEVKDFVHSLALHAAAFNPLAVSRDKLTPAYIAEQKEIFSGQMQNDPKMADKPEQAKAKILEGKLNKYLAEICFVDQAYVKDDKMSVQQALDNMGKQAGGTITIKSFVYVKVGV